MTAGTLQYPYTTPVFDQNGNLSPNATLFIANTGTMNPAAVYADPGLTTPLTNPLTSDSAGRFVQQSTQIWANTAVATDAYLTLTDGETLTFLQVYPQAPGPSLSNYLSNPNVNLTGTPTSTTPSVGDNSSKIATTAFVKNSESVLSILPSGVVALFPVDTLPSGWLIMDGSTQSVTTYPGLASLLGTKYGGDGVTTFGLPNAGGYFIRGWTSTQTIDPGRSLGTSQAQQDQDHNHQWGTSQNNFSGYPSVACSYASGGDNGVKMFQTLPPPYVAFTSNASTAAATANTTATFGSDSRPTNLSLIYMIKT